MSWSRIPLSKLNDQIVLRNLNQYTITHLMYFAYCLFNYIYPLPLPSARRLSECKRTGKERIPQPLFAGFSTKCNKTLTFPIWDTCYNDNSRRLSLLLKVPSQLQMARRVDERSDVCFARLVNICADFLGNLEDYLYKEYAFLRAWQET